MTSPLPISKSLRLEPKELEVDFIELEALKAIRESAQQILNRIKRDIRKPDNSPMNYRELVWPAINSANYRRTKPGLRLVPLERIGAEQGLSGSKVMLAYFLKSDKPDNKHLWSTPMVLKIARTHHSAHRKLRAEQKNADIVRGFVVEKNRFALPFSFRTGRSQSYSVLWSRFTRTTKHQITSKDVY